MKRVNYLPMTTTFGQLLLRGHRHTIIPMAIISTAFLSACGQQVPASGESGVAAVSESTSTERKLSQVEAYHGTEKGGVCTLTIKRNDQNQVVQMLYVSENCKDPAGGAGCKLDLEKRSGKTPNFEVSPSVQYPGYTRLGYEHGVGSPFPLSVVTEDNFILRNDSFTSLKVVRRSGLIYILPIPVSFNWISDCLDLQKMDPEIASRLGSS